MPNYYFAAWQEIPINTFMKRESEINSINAYLVLITSLLAICIVTLPERIPLKIAIASECERP